MKYTDNQSFKHSLECLAIARMWERLSRNDERLIKACKRIGWGSTEHIEKILGDVKALYKSIPEKDGGILKLYLT